MLRLRELLGLYFPGDEFCDLALWDWKRWLALTTRYFMLSKPFYLFIVL